MQRLIANAVRWAGAPHGAPAVRGHMEPVEGPDRVESGAAGGT